MTLADLLKSSLEDIGVLDPGVQLSNYDKETGLRTFNTLLKLTAAQRLGIYTVTDENFPLVDGTGTYTIGSGGTFDTVRPHKIVNAFVRSSDGVDYPLEIIAVKNYDDISLKTVNGTIPQWLYYATEYPLAKINLQYLPGTGYTLYLKSWKPLTAVSTIPTELVFPDEYEAYFQYKLAIMLAPKYQRPVPIEVAELYREAEMALKNLHAHPITTIATDPFRRAKRSNIFGDE